MADDTQKMLRTIINGQSAFRQEVVSKIDNLGLKLTKKIDEVSKDLKDLTGRVDNIGKQLAYLEDDAPTRDEFSTLEKRVNKLERKTSAQPV